MLGVDDDPSERVASMEDDGVHPRIRQLRIAFSASYPSTPSESTKG